LVDSDNDSSTGLEHRTGIGADYLLEAYIDGTTVSSPVVKLYKYVGGGSTWDWEEAGSAEVSASVYAKTVLNDTLEVVVGKNYLIPLAGGISFTVYISNDTVRCDYVSVKPGSGGPVPIPEPALLVVAPVIVVVSAILLLFTRDRL